jgi:hypothetical protein
VISPFSSLILLILVFSILLLVRLDKGLSVLFIFLKNLLFLTLIFLYRFYISLSLILALILINSSHLLVWGLACSCFSKSLKWIIRLFMCDLSGFF